MAKLFSRIRTGALFLIPRRQFSKTGLINSNNTSGKESFFQRLWDTADFSPIKDAHSKILTANTACYELVFERVKPEFVDEYLKESDHMNKVLSERSDFSGELLGSWTTVYGDCDETVQLWMYGDGYRGASQKLQYMRENQELKDYIKRKGKWLVSSKNQLLHEFSFWGSPQPRKPSHIYELRSYSLKPGTLIEWGNNWGQAINLRRKDAVGGFFSQIGDLYQVHHIWAYEDLEHRKKAREKMWQQPGWDDCVAATVPLIRHMKAHVLQPTEKSPMQ